jgi:hypothetical protein
MRRCLVRARVACLAIALGGVACSSPSPGDAADAGGDRVSDAGRDSTERAKDATVDAPKDKDGVAAESSPLDAQSEGSSPSRNALAQPFASTSIWNMPIGSGATYVTAGIKVASGTTLEADDDVIVLTPTAPATQIFTNTADWDPTMSRCPVEGALLFSAPMPASFVVPDPMAQTPNSGLAILLADSRTIKQTQPFARCTAAEAATSHYVFSDVDLYGDGIPGAHGGSNLSAIGGTLRIGELRPKGAPPHHALKLELYAAQNYYNDGKQADCYRWPASNCDGYFDTSGSSLKYGGTNPSLGPGSLLALPVSTTLASLGLTTEPAQMLAWTLQNYGAYLVDDTAWSAVAICVENGAEGSFESQFQSDYGFSIDTAGTSGSFAEDMAKVVAALDVVANNTASTIGGGGTPLQPLAPPLTAPPGDE